MGRVKRQIFQAKALNLTLVYNMCITVDGCIRKGQNLSEHVHSAAVLHYSLSLPFHSYHHAYTLTLRCSLDIYLTTQHGWSDKCLKTINVTACIDWDYRISLSLLWKQHASGKAFCSTISSTLWSQVQKSLESSDNVAEVTAEPCCTSNTSEK